MTQLEQLLKLIVGQKIVSVKADKWETGWLTSPGDVEIHLENGVVIRSLGEPLAVEGFLQGTWPAEPTS